MGLLTVGEPLSWPETKALADFVRDHGIQQFLNIFHARRHRSDETLKWGDEIEYMVFKFDHTQRKVRFSLRAATELLSELQKPEERAKLSANRTDITSLSSLWRPEFAAYMVEGTPGIPYGISPTPVENALKIESSHEAAAEADEDSIDEIELDGGMASREGSGTCTPQSGSTSPTAAGSSSPAGSKRPSLVELPMFSFFTKIEANMRLRRKEVMSLLGEDEALLSISSYPRTGTADCCYPPAFVDTVDGYSKSLFFPDAAINQGHPRFRTLSKHICERRGTSANIQLPIYRDTATASPFIEDFFESANIDRANLTAEQLEEFRRIAQERQATVGQPDHVYMDAMGFGMGCCCLQVTFQASNLCEARLLYDQLTPLTPILMALSAASPAFRGYLTDVDCRWNVISGSVDDRTVAERSGVDPVTGQAVQRIPKSRYDSIDMYIYPSNAVYNDINVVVNEKYLKQLKEGKVDDVLAEHVAHLFIRDPLVLFKEKLDIDDKTESDHFENIQSTNWQSMRFKPPPPGDQNIGWRVEFRPMEVQLTDEENAAFVVFIVLMTRLILSFNLDMLIPISRVEENMAEGQKRDAAIKSKFWFRKDISLPQCVVSHLVSKAKPECETSKSLCEQLSNCPKRPALKRQTMYDHCVLMTADEILNGSKGCAGSGSGSNFPGLLPLLNSYLDSMDIDAETRCAINRYLAIIANRARGVAPTPARLIRDFILHHPDYKQDSVVNDSVTYDLMQELWRLQSEQMTLAELLAKIEAMKQPNGV